MCNMVLDNLIIFTIFFFALGAILASFIGVVVDRYGTGESWITGRSRCGSCNVELSVLDLTPIISWVMLRGRCRKCKSKVSYVSTLAEITLGLVFAISYIKLGISIGLALLLISFVFLFAIILYDIRHTVVPGVFLVPFVFGSIAFRAFETTDIHSFGFIFLVSSVVALTLAIIHFASKGKAMGLADTPITFGLALIAGTVAFSGFIYSFWIGAIVGLIILARTPKGCRVGIEVPMAPFLAAGFLVAFFTGWSIFTFII